MDLAKNCIDIGLWTNNAEEMIEFWTNVVGLPYEERLPTGKGRVQHRLGLNGSVLKLNNNIEPVTQTPPSGYRELFVVTDVAEPESMNDPDGNLVTLVPSDWRSVTRVGIRMRVSSLDAATTFFERVLQAEKIDDASFRWASTVFFMEEEPGLESGGIQGLGYRYTTVQVHKVDSEHTGLLERGAQEAGAPLTLGSTARISFITDPDGNWIEVSQRASLTGDLEPG